MFKIIKLGAILAVLLSSVIPNYGSQTAASSYSPNPIPVNYSYHNSIVQEKIDAYDAKKVMDAGQLDCLAKAIYHESRGESKQGKIAVAMVVLNRVSSDIFPNTICEVIYQKGQFQWSAYKMEISNAEAWEDAVALAKYVGIEYNQIIDKTYGAVFFHEKAYKPRWKAKKIAIIGRHVFYRIPGEPIYNADYQN